MPTVSGGCIISARGHSRKLSLNSLLSSLSFLSRGDTKYPAGLHDRFRGISRWHAGYAKASVTDHVPRPNVSCRNAPTLPDCHP